MKELELKFTKYGKIFTEVDRSEYGYIYEVKDGQKIYYEVFKRLENTYYNCISYPGANSFGYTAWTTPFKERAIQLLKRINESAKASLLAKEIK
jgi:hypothetical protein